MTEFQDFPKMARWSRDIVVTEKIDGTNAQVFIRPGDGAKLEFGIDCQVEVDGVPHLIRAGSRTRWLGHAKADDNFSFAVWVHQNAHELAKLGAGRHFGEWWGSGVQRGYGLAEKRFSLFNVSRWYDTHQDGNYVSEPATLTAAPACCHVVPVLIRGPIDTKAVDIVLSLLRERGSYAAPGFMKPEGVIVWHTAANIGFKKTVEKDELNKYQIAEKEPT